MNLNRQSDETSDINNQNLLSNPYFVIVKRSKKIPKLIYLIAYWNIFVSDFILGYIYYSESMLVFS